MINFKEIAEKCLAGELKGTFKNRKGENIPSEALFRSASKTYPYNYCISHCVTVCGNYYKSCKPSKYDIIDFIPDNIQEQIKIDIPEGKVPVMEQTEKGVVITWKDKELTYKDIMHEIAGNPKHIVNFSYGAINDTTSSFPFYRKVEVLRKLTNIRNYFGKPDLHDTGWFIMSVWPKFNRFGAIKSIEHSKCPETVIFKEKEHAEQAIKMLGDELKYLFEPW